MKAKLEIAVKACAEKASKDNVTGAEAMCFTQAAMNAVKALEALAFMETKTKD